MMNLPSATTFVVLLVIGLSHIATAQTLPGNSTDRLALLSFKSFLVSTGAPPSVLSSWNDSTNVCHWTGITCGAIHPDRVTSLSLELLDLHGAISPSLGNLTFLRDIHLPNNKLHGRIPREIGLLRQLEYLNLTMNYLEGQIPDELSLCSKIQVMVLRNNQLRGSIPANLSRCSDLRTMSLRENMLTGNIPLELGSLQNLDFLALGNNNLTGSIPSTFGNLTSLSVLSLSFNDMTGEVPPELNRIRGLGILDLFFNRFSGKLPYSLYNFSRLYSLGLGNNGFSGSLASDFGKNLPCLTYLYLYDNHFDGNIPSSMSNASLLEILELSNNRFTGPVPPDLGVTGSLSILQLGGNQLEARTADEWNFIASLTNCISLEELDLSENKFSWALPESIGNLSYNLEWLRLRDNRIPGRIPVGIGNLSNIVTLDMENNMFTGPIPTTFTSFWKLQALSLHNNNLIDEIPPIMGNFTQLTELYLSKNKFYGSIPRSFASLKKLQVLDMSYNNLSGIVPDGLLGISSLVIYLNLSNNALEGPVPQEVGKLMNLRALDLSWNKFSTRIPIPIGECFLLEYLYLQGNHFSGGIPESWSNLRGIQILDLSQNQLSGPVPTFFETLTSLVFFNLSYNDFEGEVPTGGAFGNISSFSILGNKNVCGGNPKLNLKACLTKDRHKSSKAKLIIIVTLVALVCSLLLVLCILKMRKQRKTNSKKSSHQPLEISCLEKGQFSRVSYADLYEATKGFSSTNIVGRGGFGTVYKGFLVNEGIEVAVKVISPQLHGASKSFMAECEALRSIRHRNLVRIITSCVTEDFSHNEFRALVYEYMPNRSLDMWLHREPQKDLMGFNKFEPRTLNLLQRVNIAIDVASALDYLHNGTETPIVHRDLKPGNILLKQDMTACVGDFGVSKLLLSNNEIASTGIKGSIGYIAPECAMEPSISTLWDVYSFGVVLLEMFTGNRPTDIAFMECQNLHEFVSNKFPTRVMDILDTGILEELGVQLEMIHDCVVMIIKTALLCSSEKPQERIQMKEVLKQLEDAKTCIMKSIKGIKTTEKKTQKMIIDRRPIQ